jgi:putative hemolysin
MTLFAFALACIGRIFFALARSALINIRRHRLVELEQKGVASASAIKNLTDNSSRFLATAEVGALLSLVFAAGVAGAAFTPGLAARITEAWPGLMSASVVFMCAFALTMFATALFLFVVGRLVPEAIAMRYTEPIALRLVLPMQVSGALLTPLVRVAVVLSNWLSIPFGGQKRESATLVTEEELKTMVDAGQEEGLIEQDEKQMILSVLDFGDTVARELMVPRIDIVALDGDTPFEQAVLEVVKAGHSRIPVYQESIDNIIGVLYAKDILRALADGRKPAVSQMVRAVSFTPESKKINELLAELQKSRVHLAIVVDEFGGTAGLVTIEDILEEIVGEIQDEYDVEEPDVVPLADGTGYMLDAGINIDDVNELLGITLINEEVDTLAGFIYDHLGKVPDIGDTVRQDGYVMEVTNVRDRRILKVKVTHAPKPEDDSDAEKSAQSDAA